MVTIVVANGRRAPLVLVLPFVFWSFAVESKLDFSSQFITLLPKSLKVLTQRNNLIQPLNKERRETLTFLLLNN